MTEPGIALVRELSDDLPTVVTLEWDGDQVAWVQVDQGWQDEVGSAELLRQVVRAYREGRPAADDWRLTVSLADLPVADWAEFGALLREARESDPASPAEPTAVRGRQLESLWSQRGDLLGLRDPRCWLVQAPRQSVAEELTAVLQRPVTRSGPTAQVRRLQAFSERSTRR